MKNRIVTAVFKDSAYTKSDNAWQWDYGQILRIQGLKLPTAVEVHFAVSGVSESITRIGTTKDGVTDVVIPDSLIETGKNLVAYVYLRDSESGNTEYQIDIVVSKRAKPEAYNTPDDPELFGKAIEAVNKAADRAEKAGQAATEAAGQAAEDAQQTAEDRKEVAKMVETVSDISEQVKKVEKLSNKAQESATQAGTSATAAEKAKAQAETAAGKTAEDRTAVNQAKITVDEVQKAVRADRAAVEEVKQSVEQLSNAIPESTQAGVQAVNQAKQTAVDEIVRTGISHKTAVEGAGTQAVESVENVQQVATEAVETAKTEAVQAVQAEGTKQTGNVSAEGAKQIKEVQDKGAEVLQSIPEDFATQMETKLNKQQGIGNKGKVLVIGEDGNVVPGEVSSGGGDGIAIINTMSGESPLVIPDSAERVNKGLELGGKTDQVQTSGKNLFDIAKCPLEHSGISFKIAKSSGDVVLMDGYVFEENTQYTISAQKITSENENSASFKFDYVDGSKSEILVKDIAKKSLTSTSGKTVKRFLVINLYGGIQEVFNFQFEKGATSTPYEPYTGGKPSPSQEYQQEIKSVGKWNESTQKYEIEVVLSGKNLLDITACEDGKTLDANGNIVNNANALLSDFIPCFSKTSYCRVEGHFTAVSFYDVEKNKIGSINQYDPCFATPDKCRYFRFSLNKTKADYEKAVANVGTALMDYEPYKKPQTLTLTSDRPLTKWDRLVEQGGQIGWLYQSAAKEYIGDNSVALYDTGFCFKLSDKKIVNGEGYCKELKQYVPREENPCIAFNMSANIYAYTLNTQEIYGSTVRAIKEYLKSHPLHLAYKTETPEFIPLPQSEQNAIRALKTYYPTTVITTDGGELDPDIKVTYTADTKNYIDGKVSAKVASILRQYQADTVNLLSLLPMETQAAMIENDTNRILENVEEMKYE